MAERGNVIWNAYAAVHAQSEAIKRWQRSVLNACPFLKERAIVKDTHITCALLSGMPASMLTLPRAEEVLECFSQDPVPIKLSFQLTGTVGFQGNALVVRTAPNKEFRVKAAKAVLDLVEAIDDKQIGSRPIEVKLNNQAHLTLMYVYTTDEAKRGAIIDATEKFRPAMLDTFTGELIWKFTKAGQSLIEATGRGWPMSPIPYELCAKIKVNVAQPLCGICDNYHQLTADHDYRERRNCQYCLDIPPCLCAPRKIHWKDAIVHCWFSRLVPGLLEGASIDPQRLSHGNINIVLPDGSRMWLEDRECLSVAFFVKTRDPRITMIFHEKDDFYAYHEGRFQYIQPVRKFPASDLVLSFVKDCFEDDISILRRFDDTFTTISTKNENSSLLPVVPNNHRFVRYDDTIRWNFKDIDFLDGQSIESTLVMKLGHLQKNVDVLYTREIRRIDTLCLIRSKVSVNGQVVHDLTRGY